jgi:hypothetical protein
MSAPTPVRPPRHRGVLATWAFLLLAGGLLMVVNDRRARTGREDRPDQYDAAFPEFVEMFERTLPANDAAGVVLVLAAAAVVAGIARPRLARRSPPVAAGLVVVAALSFCYVSVRTMLPRDIWPGGAYGDPRAVDVVLLVTDVTSAALLAAGIAVPLLRRGRSGPAATGAAVLWGGVLAVVLVRQSFESYVPPSAVLSRTELRWALAADALLVVAAALLVTAWCAGPPADRERVLARCRGALAAVALLLPSTAVDDILVAQLPIPPGQIPADWWLLLRAGLTLATAVAAAVAVVLLPRRDARVPAAAVAALGLAWAAVHFLPAFGGFDLDAMGVYPVLLNLVAPVGIAAVVAAQTMASSVRSASPVNRDASKEETSTAGDEPR